MKYSYLYDCNEQTRASSFDVGLLSSIQNLRNGRQEVIARALRELSYFPLFYFLRTSSHRAQEQDGSHMISLSEGRNLLYLILLLLRMPPLIDI